MQRLRMPCRGYQFDPWSGKIPHAAEQLSPGATLPIPCSRASALQQEKPPQWEACTGQLDSSSHLPQLEKAHTRQQRPHAAKK